MTDPLISSLQGKLIVSCQAYVGEPMRHPETMAQVALSAERGGAAAIRCQGLADIAAIKGQVEIPVIGLWKEGHDGVYITPDAAPRARLHRRRLRRGGHRCHGTPPPRRSHLRGDRGGFAR